MKEQSLKQDGQSLANGERVAYSLKEFAALFGHSYFWCYRLRAKGLLKTIKIDKTEVVPASEVNRLLEIAK